MPPLRRALLIAALLALPLAGPAAAGVDATERHRDGPAGPAAVEARRGAVRSADVRKVGRPKEKGTAARARAGGKRGGEVRPPPMLPTAGARRRGNGRPQPGTTWPSGPKIDPR